MPETICQLSFRLCCSCFQLLNFTIVFLLNAYSFLYASKSDLRSCLSPSLFLKEGGPLAADAPHQTSNKQPVHDVKVVLFCPLLLLLLFPSCSLCPIVCAAAWHCLPRLCAALTVSAHLPVVGCILQGATHRQFHLLG